MTARSFMISALLGCFVLLIVALVAMLLPKTPALLRGFAVSQPSSDELLPVGFAVADRMTPPLEALLAQADAAIAEGELRRAATLIERALESGGGVAVVRKLFDAALLLRDREKAESALGLLSFHGAPESALDALRGMLLLGEGDSAGAREIFQNGARQPERAFGLLLANILAGDHGEAEELLAVIGGSSDPFLRHAAASLKGAYDEFALFEGGKALHLQTLLARSLADIRQCPVSEQMLAEVVRGEPGYRDAWIVLGYCRLMLDDAGQALDAFARAYDLDPGKAETQYFLGLAHERLARHSPQSEGGLARERSAGPVQQGADGFVEHREEAERFFRYALQNGFRPQRSVRERLARLALERGENGEAADLYRAIVSSGEADASVYRALVTILTGKLDGISEARQFALKAREELGDDNADILDLVGWTALLAGDLDEAATFLNAAARQDPSHASAWEHKGMLEEQTGGREQAIASYRKAYELLTGVDDESAARVAKRHNALVQ